MTKLQNALSSNSNSNYQNTASILSLAGSIGGAGLAAGSAAVSENTIGNTISATITNSTVTAGGDVSVTALSGAEIVSMAAGIGIALGGAFNASASTNTIHNSITAEIDRGSTVAAGAGSALDVTATDGASVYSLAISLAGALGIALGGAVVTNNIGDNTLAEVGDTQGTRRTELNSAGSVLIEAQSGADITAVALGASIGMVAGGESQVTSNIGGTGNQDTTYAHLGNYADVGTEAGQSVGSLTIEAMAGIPGTSGTPASPLTIQSGVWGLSGGIGAATYNTATSTATPVVAAYNGSNTTVDLTGDMTISATATPEVESDVNGVAVGVLAAGGSVATATALPTVTADAAGHITAADLTVEASDAEASGTYSAEAPPPGRRAASSPSTRPTAPRRTRRR